jgi:secreted trypsin-like serine protease
VKKYENKYYLRGVVSSALFDRELFMCDVKNYAVFTDVAAYTPWITQHIDLYG